MSKCSVDNCVNKVYGHGYCEKHYTQIRKHGKIVTTRYDVKRFEETEKEVLVYFYNKDCQKVGTAFVDIEDYPKIKNYVWFLDKNGYAIAHAGKTTVKMHRIILGASDSEQVDHQDLNVLNNRKSNLRLCNISQNNYNRDATKTSRLGIKGVSFHKRSGFWVAQISYQGKHYNLGDFSNPLEAAKAYNSAAVKFAGKFSRINDLEHVKKICIERGLI